MPIKNLLEKSMQIRMYEEPFDITFLKKNRLYKLEKLINWDSLEQQIESILIVKIEGRPKHPIRIMIGLLMLQVLGNKFDKDTSETLDENIAWQYFCGIRYLNDLYSVSEKSIRVFRADIGERGLNIIMKELLTTAMEIGLVKKKSLENIIVDTTVQQKNIRHPHQANLLYTARKKIIKLYKKYYLDLNNTYAKPSRTLIFQIWYFSKNRDSKKKDRCIKKLKIYLGRLIRNFKSQLDKKSIALSNSDQILFCRIEGIYNQSALKASCLKIYKKSEKYIYSLHAPEVECIVKGKLNKSAEFGNKVSVAVTGEDNFILGIKSFHGNPYDGHTLAQTIETISSISPIPVKNVYTDMGYRGHNWDKKSQVYHRKCAKRLDLENKRMLKRRNAIEPVIGHLKNYGRMACNRLKGILGDILNPILSAIGFNLKAILNFLQSKAG